MTELDGVALKFRRAQYHLNCLKSAYVRLQKANQRVAPANLKSTLGDQSILEPRVRPDARWGLMIGDCVHNFRSALDHRMFQIVPEATRLEYADKIDFPIFSAPAKYSQWKRMNAKWLAAVDPKAVEIIDRLQPGDGGNPNATRHVLWLLRQLSNLDKHRRIHVAFLVISQVSSKDVEALVVRDLEPETGTITLGIAPLPDHVTVELQITLDVTFQDGEDIAGLPVFTVLVYIGGFVASALNRLKPYRV
jgi:hypothetical protein